MGMTPPPEAVNTALSTLPAHERLSAHELLPAQELSVLATVAHELRGPLTALAQSSELLA